MNLTMVTMTGADDSVEAAQLGEMSKYYPFLEWGILASAKQVGSYRFPSLKWIRVLQTMKRMYYPKMKLCLHLCGSYVRDLLSGNNNIPPEMLEGFERVQLNFHNEDCPVESRLFAKALDDMNKQYIFQIDEKKGRVYLREYNGFSAKRTASPLFDASGGAGVVAASWPTPFMSKEQKYVPHGYAGGLGPHNIDSELTRIAFAASGQEFWIDMETHVRSYGDSLFDLAKVRSVLESVKDKVKA